MDALPSLVWVLIDGAPRHVSEFAHLPPSHRPAARCPHCERQLTLKLGRVRRHHAAHDAGQSCPATQPETALHLNCKLALAAALRGSAGPDAVLSIVRRCAGAAGDRCDETMLMAWARGWDTVLVEQAVGDASRPDITLARDGTPIAAIEILVSHAVSPDKALALETLSVPWIEIVADERFMHPDGWMPDDPLPAAHASAQHDWRCRAHADRHALMLRTIEEQRAAERETQRESIVLRAARVVDVYHDDGGRDRFIYRVTERLLDGQVQEVRLHRGGAVVESVAAASREEARSRAWPALRVAFTADVQRFAHRAGSFADSPMRWATGDAAENIVDEAMTDRVGYDPTPLASRYPRRWFYAKDNGRWFLPADMRDVRWDRPALDAFAPHPAWARDRMSVREQPAPEGSWPTPVFAARPIASMFRECVRSVARPGDASLAVVELASTESSGRVAIVILEQATTAPAIESVAEQLDAAAVDAFWISHPRDWSPALTRTTWAPAGRDWKGRGGVVIDGLGIFRADQFARALVKRDRRLSAEAVRHHMEARVKRMFAFG